MCVDLKFARINKKHNTRYNFLIYYSYGGAQYELCIFFIYPFWYMAYIFLKHTHHSLSLLSLKKYITLIYNIKIYIFFYYFLPFLLFFFFDLVFPPPFPLGPVIPRATSRAFNIFDLDFICRIEFCLECRLVTPFILFPD